MKYTLPYFAVLDGQQLSASMGSSQPLCEPIRLVRAIPGHVVEHMWQSQVENELYKWTNSISHLECFIEITPNFLCPFMNKFQSHSYWQSLVIAV